MNWVGGARSRVKAKDAMKKQREFFEKRRFQNIAAGSSAIHRKSENADGPTATAKTECLSQDVIFIRTLMKENTKPVNRKAAQVVHVDLEGPRHAGSKSVFPQRRTTAMHVELPITPDIKSSMNVVQSRGSFDVDTLEADDDGRKEELPSIAAIGTPPEQMIPSENPSSPLTIPLKPLSPMNPTDLNPYRLFEMAATDIANRSEGISQMLMLPTEWSLLNECPQTSLGSAMVSSELAPFKVDLPLFQSTYSSPSAKVESDSESIDDSASVAIEDEDSSFNYETVVPNCAKHHEDPFGVIACYSPSSAETDLVDMRSAAVKLPFTHSKSLHFFGSHVVSENKTISQSHATVQTDAPEMRNKCTQTN